MTLDAGEVYSAVKQFGLVAVAKEIYSDGKYIIKTFLTPLFTSQHLPVLMWRRRLLLLLLLSVLQEAVFCL